MSSAGRRSLRHVPTLLLHYFLALFINFRHEVVLAFFILFVNNSCHFLFFVEHAAVHDQFFFLLKQLFRSIVGLLSVLELFGHQLWVEYKFFLFFAFEYFHHFPALPLLLLLFLKPLLVQTDSDVKLIRLVSYVFG